MIIAKRIPAPEETAGKVSEVAAAFGLTVDEFKRARLDFLEGEGFDQDGNEYDTLYDWLTKDHKQFIDNTPYQKGDDLNN